MHYHILTTEPEIETIQTLRSGTIEPLTSDIVMRSMTRTLEARAVITERHGASQMDTTLVERNPMGTIVWILDNRL
jgi:hypothetical protein